MLLTVPVTSLPGKLVKRISAGGAGQLVDTNQTGAGP